MRRTDMRRTAIFAAVDAYNAANPEHPLPHPAARLLAVMFPSSDECRLSQDALMVEGGFSRKALPPVLRALVEAGLIEKDPGASRRADWYRLRLPLEGRL